MGYTEYRDGLHGVPGWASTEYRDGLHGVPAPKKRTTFGWRTCCKNVISFSISEEMAVLLCVVLTATE